MNIVKAEQLSPQEILKIATAHYENICVASSFGKDSIVLLHMLRYIKPDMAIVFLSTGFEFPETLEFISNLVKEWDISVEIVEPLISVDEQNEVHGADLYQTNPALCCSLRKVEPMMRVLKMGKYDAWITGLRRDESEYRKNISVIEEGDGLVKFNPLANWTEKMVWDYIHAFNVPFHPLYLEGYRSLGCKPCTLAGRLGQFERAGRWTGTELEGGECGLHTSLKI